MPDPTTEPDIIGTIAADARVELSRADQKAQTIFGVAGVITAAVAVLSQRPMPIAAAVATAVAVLALSVALLVLLAAVSPRLSAGAPGSWVHVARNGPSSLLAAIETVRSQRPEERERAAVADVAFLCALADRKFRLVRRGRDWLVLGLLTVLVSRALAVLA